MNDSTIQRRPYPSFLSLCGVILDLYLPFALPALRCRPVESNSSLPNRLDSIDEPLGRHSRHPQTVYKAGQLRSFSPAVAEPPLCRCLVLNSSPDLPAASCHTSRTTTASRTSSASDRYGYRSRHLPRCFPPQSHRSAPLRLYRRSVQRPGQRYLPTSHPQSPTCRCDRQSISASNSAVNASIQGIPATFSKPPAPR